MSIGEKLHIIQINSEGEEEYLVSQLLEKMEDGIAVIAMPIKEGKLVPIHIGKEIKVIYYRENGQYYFTAKVIDREKGKIPALKIERTSGIYKLQRRQFFRLNIVLPLKVYTLERVNEAADRVMETYTIDISGGGLRFALGDDEVSQGQYLICEFRLDQELYSLKGKVVRKSRVYGEEYSYEAGVQFVDIDEKIRQDILCFIFEQQRKMRQKGMI